MSIHPSAITSASFALPPSALPVLRFEDPKPRGPSLTRRVSHCFVAVRDQAIETKERICQCSVIRYSPVITDATLWVTYSANSYAVQLFINMFTRSATASGSSFTQYSKLFSSLKAVKIGAVALIPFALYSVYSEARNCITGPDRVDAGLRTLESLGWVSDSSAAFLDGLRLAGAVSEGVGAAVFSCMTVGAVLSVATIALNSRHIYQGHKFLKRMELAERLGNHAGIINMITGNEGDEKGAAAIEPMTSYMIHKHFNVDGVKLGANLKRINDHAHAMIRSKSRRDQVEGEKILERTSECLIDRVRSRNFSYGLAILSATVTLIGLALLLTVFAPFGYGLMATGAFISICKFFHEKYALEKFEKKIEFDAIVTPPEAMAVFRG